MSKTLDIKDGRALGDYRMFNIENPHDEIVLKASFIILGNAIAGEKIIANFNLTVLGNIEAKNVEVKGKLICFGSIKAERIFAKEIVATNINATEIDVSDGIMAQEIVADSIKATDTILIGKNITVEEFIETRENIICGEGLYAYGKVKAKTIISADNIDIASADNDIQKVPISKVVEHKDNVVEAIGSYSGWKASKIAEIDKLISCQNIQGLEEYFAKNSEFEFISKYICALEVVKEALTISESDRKGDLILFLKLHKIICEIPSMKQFEVVANYRNHVEMLVNAAKTNLFESNIKCEFHAYSEFIEAITIIQQYGDKIEKQIFVHVINKVYNSGLGIKDIYLNSIFQRRGWKIND